MNLLSIARKLWRYKLVTLPVVLLTLGGAVYVVAVKEPVYEASSSYILINPPLPPTEEDIARNPALGRINADNPYTRFDDQTVVVEVLASGMSSKAAEQRLLQAGADPRYEVAPADAFGFSSPIVKITTQGATSAAAVKSAKLVGSEVTRQLRLMQKAEGIDPDYWIKANQVDAPEGAELKASGQLRMLVAVLALGTLLLFVVVSLADALALLRRERLSGQASSWVPESDGSWPVYDGRSERPGLEPQIGPALDEEPEGSRPLVSLFPDRQPGAAGEAHGRRRRRGFGS